MKVSALNVVNVLSLLVLFVMPRYAVSMKLKTFFLASSSTPVPKYCPECGSPYPWTQSILDNALELLSLDVDLDDDTKNTIREAIPNLIVETPSTTISVQKYKMAIEHASQIVKDGLYNLLKDVVSEGIKTLLFP